MINYFIGNESINRVSSDTTPLFLLSLFMSNQQKMNLFLRFASA